MASKKTSRKKQPAEKRPVKAPEKKPLIEEENRALSPEVPQRHPNPPGVDGEGETGDGEPVRGEDVVVCETDEDNVLFNTLDAVSGRVVEMKLKRGNNCVPRADFEAFEEDEFFSANILDKVVRVVSRPAASLDTVDI